MVSMLDYGAFAGLIYPLLVFSLFHVHLVSLVTTTWSDCAEIFRFEPDGQLYNELHQYIHMGTNHLMVVIHLNL